MAGVVKCFDADEGWGVIVAPEVPGDCFVHFSVIQAPGFRELRVGQQVQLTYEDPASCKTAVPSAPWPSGPMTSYGDGQGTQR